MASQAFQDRAVGAVLGSFVADAAAVPLHWIYNQEKLDSILSGYGGCEFVEKSHCPFYTVPTGSFSCYGDQAFAVLECLNEGNGYNEEEYKKALKTTFGADTDYDAEKKLGRPIKKEDCPITGPWRNGSIKEFLKNEEEKEKKIEEEKAGKNEEEKTEKTEEGKAEEIEEEKTEEKVEKNEEEKTEKTEEGKAEEIEEEKTEEKVEKNEEEKAKKTGADDTNADGFAKVAPIVCLYAGTTRLEKKVEEIVRVTQDNDLAVAAAVAGALILEEYILQGPKANAECIKTILPKVSPLVREHIQKALDAKDMSHKEAVREFGLSCSLPGSLQGVVHCLVQSDGNFVNTVRSTIEAGGDNCARCCLVGACMGAKVGLREIPHKWVAEASRGLEVIQQTAQFMDLRKASYEATLEAIKAKTEEGEKATN